MDYYSKGLKDKLAELGYGVNVDSRTGLTDLNMYYHKLSIAYGTGSFNRDITDKFPAIVTLAPLVVIAVVPSLAFIVFPPNFKLPTNYY